MWIKKVFCLIFDHLKYKDSLGRVDKDGNELCVRCGAKLEKSFDDKPDCLHELNKSNLPK